MRKLNVHGATWLAAVMCLSAAGCMAESGEAPGDGSEETAAEALRACARLSPGQIAGVLIAANDAEISEGSIAAQEATEQRVRTFAAQMVVRHSEANQQVRALLLALGIAPEESLASRNIALRGEHEVELLSELSGPAFDMAYMDGQVAAHQQVVRLIDSLLVPSAEDRQMRTFLRQLKRIVQMHLSAAVAIQRSLDGCL